MKKQRHSIAKNEPTFYDIVCEQISYKEEDSHSILNTFKSVSRTVNSYIDLHIFDDDKPYRLLEVRLCSNGLPENMVVVGDDKILRLIDFMDVEECKQLNFKHRTHEEFSWR